MIILEANGMMSSNKRAKHIKVKYFFITDKVHKEEVKIENSPAKQMWIDVIRSKSKEHHLE